MIKTVAFFALAFTVPAFAQNTTTVPVTNPSSTAAPLSPLSEGQVVQALNTINESEITAASLAVKKASNKAVKDYARSMQTEHKKNKVQSKDLANANGIDLAGSDINDTLEAAAAKSTRELKDAAKGSAFDTAYVNLQVSMHQDALALIDNQLIPAVTNRTLKAHLERTRAAVSGHLDHAKSLQTQLQ